MVDTTSQTIEQQLRQPGALDEAKDLIRRVQEAPTADAAGGGTRTPSSTVTTPEEGRAGADKPLSTREMNERAAKAALGAAGGDESNTKINSQSDKNTGATGADKKTRAPRADKPKATSGAAGLSQAELNRGLDASTDAAARNQARAGAAAGAAEGAGGGRSGGTTTTSSADGGSSGSAEGKAKTGAKTSNVDVTGEANGKKWTAKSLGVKALSGVGSAVIYDKLMMTVLTDYANFDKATAEDISMGMAIGVAGGQIAGAKFMPAKVSGAAASLMSRNMAMRTVGMVFTVGSRLIPYAGWGLLLNDVGGILHDQKIQPKVLTMEELYNALDPESIAPKNVHERDMLRAGIGDGMSIYMRFKQEGMSDEEIATLRDDIKARMDADTDVASSSSGYEVYYQERQAQLSTSMQYRMYATREEVANDAANDGPMLQQALQDFIANNPRAQNYNAEELADLKEEIQLEMMGEMGTRPEKLSKYLRPTPDAITAWEANAGNNYRDLVPETAAAKKYREHSTRMEVYTMLQTGGKSEAWAVAELEKAGLEDRIDSYRRRPSAQDADALVGVPLPTGEQAKELAEDIAHQVEQRLLASMPKAEQYRYKAQKKVPATTEIKMLKANIAVYTDALRPHLPNFHAEQTMEIANARTAEDQKAVIEKYFKRGNDTFDMAKANFDATIKSAAFKEAVKDAEAGLKENPARELTTHQLVEQLKDTSSPAYTYYLKRYDGDADALAVDMEAMEVAMNEEPLLATMYTGVAIVEAEKKGGQVTVEGKEEYTVQDNTTLWGVLSGRDAPDDLKESMSIVEGLGRKYRAVMESNIAVYNLHNPDKKIPLEALKDPSKLPQDFIDKVMKETDEVVDVLVAEGAAPAAVDKATAYLQARSDAKAKTELGSDGGESEDKGGDSRTTTQTGQPTLRPVGKPYSPKAGPGGGSDEGGVMEWLKKNKMLAALAAGGIGFLTGGPVAAIIGVAVAIAIPQFFGKSDDKTPEASVPGGAPNATPTVEQRTAKGDAPGQDRAPTAPVRPRSTPTVDELEAQLERLSAKR